MVFEPFGQADNKSLATILRAARFAAAATRPRRLSKPH